MTIPTTAPAAAGAPDDLPDHSHDRFAGGCLCGAVRYRASRAPVLRFNCHCRDCQRTTGSGFAPIAVFAEDAVEIAGEPRFFEIAGGSGKPVARGFCAHCGASLFLRGEILPGRLFVLAGTLDDPSSFAPRAHLHARHAPSWSPLDPTLAVFPDAAPAQP